MDKAKWLIYFSVLPLFRVACLDSLHIYMEMKGGLPLGCVMGHWVRLLLSESHEQFLQSSSVVSSSCYKNRCLLFYVLGEV